MQCNAFVERGPFRNLFPDIPQFAITSTTKDISSHETTLWQNAKLHLSSGSNFLMLKSPHRIGKLRRVCVRLTAPFREIGLIALCRLMHKSTLKRTFDINASKPTTSSRYRHVPAPRSTSYPQCMSGQSTIKTLGTSCPTLYYEQSFDS